MDFSEGSTPCGECIPLNPRSEGVSNFGALEVTVNVPRGPSLVQSRFFISFRHWRPKTVQLPIHRTVALIF